MLGLINYLKQSFRWWQYKDKHKDGHTELGESMNQGGPLVASCTFSINSSAFRPVISVTRICHMRISDMMKWRRSNLRSPAMLCVKLSYFERLIGEDLSRYLTKIESVGLRKKLSRLAESRPFDCKCWKCLHILALHHGGQNSWHVTVNLCIRTRTPLDKHPLECVLYERNDYIYM